MTDRTAADNADAARVAGGLSIAYIMSIATEVLHAFPLDFLDLLLVFTVASANVPRPLAPPLPSGRRRRAAGTLPDRVGISRNAVSRAVNVPLETVRRRIAGLVEKKVLIEQADGLVLSPDNPLGVGRHPKLAQANLELLRELFRRLKANGVRLD